MRTREEILEAFKKELSTCGIETYGQNKLLLEVLLDIRSLLAEISGKLIRT